MERLWPQVPDPWGDEDRLAQAQGHTLSTHRPQGCGSMPRTRGEDGKDTYTRPSVVLAHGHGRARNAAQRRLLGPAPVAAQGGARPREGAGTASGATGSDTCSVKHVPSMFRAYRRLSDGFIAGCGCASHIF